MAVPKKRTGHSSQGKRRANWKATKPETTICSNCGEPALTHTVCTACGFYKGEPVSLKDKAAKEEVKEVKKAPKKKAAAKTKKSETKVEETPVVEETKEEAKEDKSAEE